MAAASARAIKPGGPRSSPCAWSWWPSGAEFLATPSGKAGTNGGASRLRSASGRRDYNQAKRQRVTRHRASAAPPRFHDRVGPVGAPTRRRVRDFCAGHQNRCDRARGGVRDDDPGPRLTLGPRGAATAAFWKGANCPEVRSTFMHAAAM
jgi:hypothetical protein